MTKNDIIRKLSSRKFWVCLCGFATSLMAMLRFSDDSAALVTSLITSAGCLIAYILSEGYVDASHAAPAEGSECLGGEIGEASEEDTEDIPFEWHYVTDEVSRDDSDGKSE